jgi:ATP-binding cassette subfamily B protein
MTGRPKTVWQRIADPERWHKSRTLWQLMHGQRGRYAAAIAALAAGTLLMYLNPLIVRGVIDGVLGGRLPQAPPGVVQLMQGLNARWGVGATLACAGAALLAITAAGGGCRYLMGRWSAIASERIARHLRDRLYAHLQHLPMTYHDKAQTGDLVQRCTSDVDTVRLFYKDQVVEIARAVLLIVIGLPILLAVDWKLALLSMAVLPVIVLFAVFFFSRVQGSFKKTDEAEGAMTATLQENLTGIRVVRAFARQEFERDRFRTKNAGHRDLHWKLYKIMALYWASSDFLCFTQMALVLFGGAYRVAMGYTSVGTMVAFLVYAQMFIWPVRQMGRVLTELGKALVSVGRVQEILEVPEETGAERTPQAAPLNREAAPRVRGEIVLENVHFAHGTKEVLQDVSLTIPAGSTVALLGPSGSGKTTLVQLLLRMYDYDRGSIRLDGTELKDLPRKYVRSQFGVVMQEPFLYSKTLRDNVKLGRHSAEDAEMVEAATLADIHHTIQSFDKQYDTLVGERGVTLSGGQRQRTALARAVLKDAPVLVLDDALSAVDTHTETTILDSLKRRSGRHTVILIAHRLSTLMHADQIAVMEKGRIVQLGTHDRLVAEDGGLYRRLWQIQSALEEDLREDMAPQEPTGDVPTPAVEGAALSGEAKG